MQFTSLQALGRNEKTIPVEDIVQGVKKEFRKEGKAL